MTSTFALILMSLLCGVLLVALVVVLMRKKVAPAAPVKVTTGQHTVAERIRSVGKLVGLEVHAKEIATSTKGWSWLPPILLSQAKVAMIFHFEKQYFADLSKLRARDVQLLENGSDPGSDRPVYLLRLPPVEGALRLTEVTPYDIQAGRIMGLIDVIQMDAPTQTELMKAAQVQAAELFQRAESRYIQSAQRSIENHLEALLQLFDVSVRVEWGESASATSALEPLALGETLARRLGSAQPVSR